MKGKTSDSKQSRKKIITKEEGESRQTLSPAG